MSPTPAKTPERVPSPPSDRSVSPVAQGEIPRHQFPAVTPSPPPIIDYIVLSSDEEPEPVRENPDPARQVQVRQVRRRRARPNRNEREVRDLGRHRLTKAQKFWRKLTHDNHARSEQFLKDLDECEGVQVVGYLPNGRFVWSDPDPSVFQPQMPGATLEEYHHRWWTERQLPELCGVLNRAL